MKRRTFTDTYIKGLRPAGTPYKRSETAPKGEGRLIVRVLPSGVKEFFYRYRAGGGDKTLALGRYSPSRTLADIRAAYRPIRDKQLETGDVKEHRRSQAVKKALEQRRGTLGQLLATYVQSLRDAGKTSADEAAGVFARHVVTPFPDVAEAKASDIEPGDIQRILAKMVKAGITRQVNVTRAYLRAAFAFGAKADHDPRTVAKEGVLFGLKGNPVVSVPRIAEYEKTGERALDEQELRAYWKGLEALPVVQRATLRFNLSLACQRPTQLLRADWPQFDFQQSTLLLKDSKGRGGSRDHLLPLTRFSLEQLRPLRELNGHAGNGETPAPPFASDGKRPMVVETLSKAVAEVASGLNGVKAFDQRDLRRTTETMLQKLGVEKEVRAHLLSHGRTKGVQGKHYERYDFLPEKRIALEKWAKQLQRIIEGKAVGKVVQLRRS